MGISIAKAMSKAVGSTRTILSRSMMTMEGEACPRFAHLGFKEPANPIICRLGLFVEQNPIRAFVDGMWMGFVGEEGFVFFDNSNPTRDDLLRAREDMRDLSADQLAKLKTIWPRKYGEWGKKLRYLDHEYAHYSLTALGVHKPAYFSDVLELAGPYMAGGSKDLAAFITENFQVGKKYPIAEVEGVMSEHASAQVGLRLGGEKNAVQLSGINIAYLEDRSTPCRRLVLRNHPLVGCTEDIMVRVS